MSSDQDRQQNCCETCGPTQVEAHPRVIGVERCVNCKEWLRVVMPCRKVEDIG